MKTEPNPYFTKCENLVVERIRLKAARFELKLMKEAQRAGRIPKPETVMRRLVAATFDKVFRP